MLSVAHYSRWLKDQAKLTECGLLPTGTSVMEFVAIKIELNSSIFTCKTDANIDKMFN
jgi:hypothetical protein